MNAPLPEHIRQALETVTLDDKYALDHGRAFMSGVQALVKLPMLQRQRDALLGKNTAGFISGYRGSPLGGYDQALWKARDHLQAQHIVFQPGVNEELAATALWGTQQLGFAPPGSNQFDGVFGIWYGKGPGVDRSGDAMRHANMAGTSPFGGVLAVVQRELVDHAFVPGDQFGAGGRLTSGAALNQRGFVAANLYPPECSGVFHDGIEDGANAHGQCIKLRTRFPAKVPGP